MQRDSTGTEAGIATLIKSLNLRENVASLRQGTEIRGTYKEPSSTLPVYLVRVKTPFLSFITKTISEQSTVMLAYLSNLMSFLVRLNHTFWPVLLHANLYMS